ncbi:MAG: hypothetical protein JXM73_25340 [Anaerolineae bacterium]|nr:hypothetical protein [Anaerolineae bacterium]
MEPKTILAIRNRHVPSCGQPPTVDDSTGDYRGYFENEHGEQWLFVYDMLTNTATIYGGDIGWEDPVVMQEPESYDDLEIMEETDLVLSPPEVAWIRACWMAADKILHP